MEVGSQSVSSPHVLIFPLPMQGPVNSMLKLAELLIHSTDDVHVTFLTTDVVYRHLLLSAQAHERFHRNPQFSFHTFIDGLPEDHPRGGDKFLEMLDAVIGVSNPLVREMVSPSTTKDMVLKPQVTSIVSDALYSFALDVGNEVGIPVFYFETMSPCCLWVYLCLPKLVEDGELPFKGCGSWLIHFWMRGGTFKMIQGSLTSEKSLNFTENNDFDALVNVPGMEGFLRRRDLPDFCRARDTTDHIMLQRVLGQVKQIQRAHGIILNTFEDLDAHLLSYMRSHCPNLHIYTVGPLHLSLLKRLQAKSSYHSNSFWQEDRSCMAWLNKQPPKSVIFCSFGSHVEITEEQLIEFWHGLVNSRVSFLWVKRPGSVIGMEDEDYFEMLEKQRLHEDLLEGIKKRGCIVSWAPQVEVLSHPTIGGFLTHSGWNSTMESVVAGVPMVCWPHYVDQLVNSRLVTEVWKLGVDVKDTCDRATIEKVVRDVMYLRRNEFIENASKLANLATKSVHESGASYGSMESLIKDIRSSTLSMKFVGSNTKV